MASTFFQEFPLVDYKIDGIRHRITNINTAYTLITNKLSNQFLFQKYIIADYETPESIADKIYGNYALYWTILLVNNIVNPFTDWVKSGQVFNNWIAIKYQDEPDGLYGIHHFENVSDNSIVDDYHDKLYRNLGSGHYPEEIRPISNMEYENQENNKKRMIKLIDQKYVVDFAREFSKMINNKNIV